MASMSAKLEKETLGHLEAKQQLQHLQMMVRMQIGLILFKTKITRCMYVCSHCACWLVEFITSCHSSVARRQTHSGVEGPPTCSSR